ncbi:MAG: sugar transferase [Gemmatimonadales bacterium]
MRPVPAEWRRARAWKRPVDLTAVGLLAIPCALIGLIVAAVVRLRLGSPVLFRQVRPGLDGRPFVLVKFRTMVEASGTSGGGAGDADRLTPFGRWLRSTSLDELPELWNVFKGEMSLVGPRPLLMEYLPLYDAEQARRMNVPPGITGWAQVNGRNAISWPERLQLDAWYAQNVSPWLDLKILFLTLGTVFGRRGVTQAGHVTVDRFRGNV